MSADQESTETALESPHRHAMKDQATYPLPNAKNLQNRKIGAMQRDKGQRGEREFCRALSEHLGETLRQLGAARDGGPDVLLGEHWAVEVKRGETLHQEKGGCFNYCPATKADALGAFVAFVAFVAHSTL